MSVAQLIRFILIGLAMWAAIAEHNQALEANPPALFFCPYVRARHVEGIPYRLGEPLRIDVAADRGAPIALGCVGFVREVRKSARAAFTAHQGHQRTYGLSGCLREQGCYRRSGHDRVRHPRAADRRRHQQRKD
jgi:hypothetical protein